MGFATSSTNLTFNNYFFKQISDYDFTVALVGNPNVGKSTIFNTLTGMHQHTGNWPGKTVSNATGTCNYKGKNFLFVDIPGTYSLMSNSEEEEIARDYICFGKPNLTVVVVDATCLERNLNLVHQIFEITQNVVVCVNLLDEASKKGIKIDLELLSKELGVPVVGTSANKPKTLKKLLDTIYNVCNGYIIPKPQKILYSPEIEKCVEILESKLDYKGYLSRWISLKLLDDNNKIIDTIKSSFLLNYDELSLDSQISTCKDILLENGILESNLKDNIISAIIIRSEEISKKVCKTSKHFNYSRDLKIDKILTSKKFGIPIMLCFLGLIFWLTITGANYPSELLSQFFSYVEIQLKTFFNFIHSPTWLTGLLIDGGFKTLGLIVSVMLPPMAIFFPLFTILEDLGYLPRVAFNLDKYFKKSGCSGKQALTMCMGFGCNAAGVTGARIIDSPREKLLSILTNSFVPCNGKFPFLICMSSIFVSTLFVNNISSVLSALIVLALIIFGIFMTLFISKILSKTILKGSPSSFILELPPYRKPQIGKIIVRSIFDRTLFVLGRAVMVAIPAGIVLWIFSNISINGLSILTYIANFLNPFAELLGLDGYILMAFILGLPANEIVLPILLMGYINSGTLVGLEDYSTIGNILFQNNWTFITFINIMILSLLHFPCSTTLLTIKKETNSWLWTFVSFALPTICRNFNLFIY